MAGKMAAASVSGPAVETGCSCGASRLEIIADPSLRFICHCTICQRFNNAPEADMLVFRRDQALLDDAATVAFRRFKKRLAVDRGACRECGDPVVEYLSLPLTSGLAFVPTALLDGRMPLPTPSMRVFYESRVADAHDELPRHGGFLASQLAILPSLLRVLRGRV